MTRRARGALVVCVCLPVLVGCGFLGKVWNFGEDSEASTAAVFEAINREDYDAIYANLTADLQDRIAADKVRRMFVEVRREAGDCEPPKVTNYQVSSSESGTVAALDVRAECQRGAVRADLLWRLERGEPRLERFSFLREIASSASKE